MKKIGKKIIGLLCAIAMAVTSMTAIAPTTTVKGAVDDIFVDSAVKNFGDVGEYAYNYAWLCEATTAYKYMIITYTGDITNLRVQGVKGNNRIGREYWMDQTNESPLKLVGAKPVLKSETGAVVVIDLAGSGINLKKIEALDMHYGPGKLNIGYVRLSASSKVKTNVDIMPKVSAPKRTTVQSATKKNSQKSVKLSIKSVKGASGYQVQFSTTKSFKKVLVKKDIKKAVITVKHKNLKNKKKLYVRVKAYKLNVKKKVLAKKWSKAKKVSVK